MGIGLGIVMFVAGAVMAFALQIEVSWIDLDVVGNILMIAGLIAVVAALIVNRQNRQTTVRQVYDNRATPKYDPRYGQQSQGYQGYDQGGYSQQPRQSDQTRYDDQGY